MSKRLTLMTILATLLAGMAFAADTYEIDQAHSYIGFSVRHMVIATVKGNFTDFSGTIVFDSTDLSKSSVNATIKSASINTDNTRRDDHLRSADFFDAANFPEITFVSESITKTDNGYLAKGKFTMRGVTKEIGLPFQILGIITGSDGSAKMGVDVTPITINRQEYGLKWSKLTETGGLVAGDDIKIEIHLELNKKTK
ncbi:MAG: polyisoprenoid-binding protein [bacterium]